MSKLIILFSIFIFSQNTFADYTIELKNKVQFFDQDLGSNFSLPRSLGKKQNLLIQFNISNSDPATLKKVYATEITFSDLTTKLEVYYFNRTDGRYFSQQLFVYKGKTLLSKCTSYFAFDQKFLVPGICSGNNNGFLYGLAVYKD